MKVIKDNRPITRFTYPFSKTCISCKSQVEVEKGDVQVGEGEGQNGHKYEYFYVVCAVCTYHILVSPGKE